MKFKEIVSSNYKAFSRQSPDERAKNILTLKYIEALAAQVNIDIRDWDAKKLFGTCTGHKFIDDRNEINRIFFSEMERVALLTPEPSESDNLIEQSQLEMMKVADVRYVQGLIRQKNEEANVLLNQAMQYYREHEQYVRKAGVAFAAARLLENRGDISIEAQARSLNSGTFYKFVGMVDGRKIRFVTRGDITISHKNQAAGIDISLNLGKFLVQFDLQECNIRVFAHSNNTVVDGHPHPHINTNGGVCWGTASEAVTRATAQCNFVEPLNLLAGLLVNYNSISPYRSIERFQEVIGNPAEIFACEDLIAMRDAKNAMYADIPLTIDWDAARFEDEVPAIAAPAEAPVDAELGVQPIKEIEPMTPQEFSPADSALEPTFEADAPRLDQGHVVNLPANVTIVASTNTFTYP